MSTQYPWAKNPLKLARAISAAKSGDGSEDLIKAEYIKIGGLIEGEPVKNTVTEEVVSSVEVADGITEEVVVEPRKTLKKAK